MKRLVPYLGAWMLGLGFFGATEELPYITPVNNPAPMTPGKSVTGAVTNIDPVNQMIQVKDSVGMLQTLRINPQVQILRNGEIVQLTNLSLGDTVTVTTKSQ